MCGEHLPVGVDVDPSALGLLEQVLQVLQVMSGDDDGRPLLDRRGDLNRARDTELRTVGGIEHLHTDEVCLPHLHHHGEELVGPRIGPDHPESVVDRVHDGSVGPSQDRGVIRVRGHPAESEEDQGFQRADVLMRTPHGAHVIWLGDSGQSDNPGFLLLEVVRIEIDVCQRREQCPHDGPVGLLSEGAAVRRGRKCHERTCQTVLQLGHLGRLPADAGPAGAGLPACGLLALITEHRYI